MSVQSDQLPPVPEHTPPLREDEVTRRHERFFQQAWTRWFVSLRDKVNVINSSFVNLGEEGGTGFVAKDGAAWASRAIEGTPGRIEVTDGDGVSGNPVLTIPDTGVVAGSYTNVNVTVAADGRITAISNGTLPEGIPPGGTVGQVLAKLSSSDYDVGWVDP